MRCRVPDRYVKDVGLTRWQLVVYFGGWLTFWVGLFWYLSQ